jgi:hypothetical protein
MDCFVADAPRNDGKGRSPDERKRDPGLLRRRIPRISLRSSGLL